MIFKEQIEELRDFRITLNDRIAILSYTNKSILFSETDFNDHLIEKYGRTVIIFGREHVTTEAYQKVNGTFNGWSNTALDYDEWLETKNYVDSNLYKEKSSKLAELDDYISDVEISLETNSFDAKMLIEIKDKVKYFKKLVNDVD
jgi:hypothetical protein